MCTGGGVCEALGDTVGLHTDSNHYAEWKTPHQGPVSLGQTGSAQRRSQKLVLGM